MSDFGKTTSRTHAIRNHDATEQYNTKQGSILQVTGGCNPPPRLLQGL